MYFGALRALNDPLSVENARDWSADRSWAMTVVLSLVLWLVLWDRDKSGVIRPGGGGGVQRLITGVISHIINKRSPNHLSHRNLVPS